MKKYIFLVIFQISIIQVYATDNYSMPNIFSSGQTISSSKINENFNYLFELIKENLLIFKFLVMI